MSKYSPSGSFTDNLDEPLLQRQRSFTAGRLTRERSGSDKEHLRRRWGIMHAPSPTTDIPLAVAPPGGRESIERRVIGIPIQAVKFSPTTMDEREIRGLTELEHFMEAGNTEEVIHWVHVQGQATRFLTQLCESFKLHPITIERITDIHARPQVCEEKDGMLLTIQQIHWDAEAMDTWPSQISIVMLPGTIITIVAEDADNIFGTVKNSLRTGGRVRKNGAGFLVCALFDAVVERYANLLERLALEMDDMEDQLMHEADRSHLQRVYRFKHVIAAFRRSVWPLRKVTSALVNLTNRFTAETKPYLEELRMRTLHICDTVDSFREGATGMLDIYMSRVAMRTNDVVRVLTIVSTIFAPPTFIVGVYGMNFSYMPELHWTGGYPTVWGGMVLISILMLLFFKRKRWV